MSLEIQKKEESGPDIIKADKDIVNLDTIPFTKKDIDEILKFSKQIDQEADESFARDEVIRLRRDVERSYFKIGGLLYKISREFWYKKWGYETFKDYVEQEVGFSVRKAQFLIGIWNWFVVQVGDKTVIEKVAQLGWSKAAVLVGVVTKHNVDAWVEKGKQLTVAGLNAEARMVLENRPVEQAERAERKGFLLHNDQIDAVEEAINVACRIGNTDKQGQALSLICTEFLASHLGDEAAKLRSGQDVAGGIRGIKQRLITILKRFERALPIGFIVVDIENGEQIYASPPLREKKG